jgi:hypothetical protein
VFIEPQPLPEDEVSPLGASTGRGGGAPAGACERRRVVSMNRRIETVELQLEVGRPYRLTMANSAPVSASLRGVCWLGPGLCTLVMHTHTCHTPHTTHMSFWQLDVE